MTVQNAVISYKRMRLMLWNLTKIKNFSEILSEIAFLYVICIEKEKCVRLFSGGGM